MTPEKRKQLQDRVESRVQHGYSESEVSEWLLKECSVQEEVAEELIRTSFGKRKRASRTWAFGVLIFAIGAIVFGLFLIFASMSGSDGEADERTKTRTLLFGIAFLTFGATGIASAFPKLKSRN